MSKNISAKRTKKIKQKNIEKYISLRERPYMPAPVYWNAISQTSPKTKKIHGVNIKVCWGLYQTEGQHNWTRHYYLKQDWEKTASFIGEKLFNDKQYFNNAAEKMKTAEITIQKWLGQIKKQKFNNFTSKQLVITAKRIEKMWLDYDNANVPLWFLGGDKFKKLIENDLSIHKGDFLILTTPTIKTYTSQMECDLFKYANLVKTKKVDLQKIANQLSKKYGWIPFGYDGLKYWDKNYFIDKLKKITKNYSNKKIREELNRINKKNKSDKSKIKRIIRQYKLTENQLNLIDKINQLAVWTDERKMLQFQLHYYYSQVLLEIGRRYNISYKNLKYLFTEELEKIADNKSEVVAKIKKRKTNDFMAEFKNDQIKILSTQTKNKIIKEIQSQIQESNINGQVACKGIKNKYKARVKILLSPAENKKIRKGDFLVTTMTTPDYILAMKKATGFITDEGGVTCHAAIVAREMNKPCIIGTKIATEVFKDGDMVEVDADKGVVRRIK